ncbi:MAG: hypothetical protein B7Z73_01310 [Planctomycetia bacterium 21-64-5]|nr:MAG: hypothetical protein B7Z73_01310 [Planctomycetia bacterium 21-64-5]
MVLRGDRSAAFGNCLTMRKVRSAEIPILENDGRQTSLSAVRRRCLQRPTIHTQSLPSLNYFTSGRSIDMTSFLV